MTETLGKVVSQTKARVFGGDTHVAGKILSVFETSTEVIRKGKASKPTEFGKMVKVPQRAGEGAVGDRFERHHDGTGPARRNAGSAVVPLREGRISAHSNCRNPG